MRIDLRGIPSKKLAGCETIMSYTDRINPCFWVVSVSYGGTTLASSKYFALFIEALAVARQALAEIELAAASQPQPLIRALSR
jgi:hypothetical protein